MEREGCLITLLFALVCGYVPFVIATAYQRDRLLSLYCESQSAQYEIIGGEDYCVKDNQLFQIEWMEGE